MKFQELTQTNLSTFLFQSFHHSRIEEISEISVMSTVKAATLSHLRSIHEIFLVDPCVNHSIFRTAARSKISLIAPPILQVSTNNTVYTLQLQIPTSQQQPGLVLDHKPSTLQTV